MDEMKAKIIEMLTELSEEMLTEDFEKLCKQIEQLAHETEQKP